MPARRVRNPERWVLVAVAKDGPTAEEWQRLIEDAGIDAEVRLADPAIVGMPSAAARWWGNPSPFPSLVSYPLYVRTRDRSAARRIVGEQGGIGEGLKLDRGAVVGALAVVSITLLGVLAIVLRS